MPMALPEQQTGDRQALARWAQRRQFEQSVNVPALRSKRPDMAVLRMSGRRIHQGRVFEHGTIIRMRCNDLNAIKKHSQ
ncbi:hypothetical protein QU42_16985 [Bradyrhizobium sp. UASWS1016]|nr:hypothetical protein QU42_16985 [Bradyrhizobium sp. UASWS1016]